MYIYMSHLYTYIHQFLVVDIPKSPHLVDVLFFMSLLTYAWQPTLHHPMTIFGPWTFLSANKKNNRPQGVIPFRSCQERHPYKPFQKIPSEVLLPLGAQSLSNHCRSLEGKFEETSKRSAVWILEFHQETWEAEKGKSPVYTYMCFFTAYMYIHILTVSIYIYIYLLVIDACVFFGGM